MSTVKRLAGGAAKKRKNATGKTLRSTPVGQDNTGLTKTRRRIKPETRTEMLERLTNPRITLHEASVILRKCPATIRNYCDAGFLPHERTLGGQRRFYLREVLAFLRTREEEKNKKG